jgi:hypothetical protein
MNGILCEYFPIHSELQSVGSSRPPLRLLLLLLLLLLLQF